MRGRVHHPPRKQEFVRTLIRRTLSQTWSAGENSVRKRHDLGRQAGRQLAAARAVQRMKKIGRLPIFPPSIQIPALACNSAKSAQVPNGVCNAMPIHSCPLVLRCILPFNLDAPRSDKTRGYGGEPALGSVYLICI